MRGINILFLTNKMVFNLSVILICGFLFCGAASAAILNVNNSTKLQNAINSANPGDTIKLSAGTYYEHNITVNRNLTITGPQPLDDNPPTAVVDGQNQESVFYIPSGVNVTLQYLLIQNGNTTYSGGGIHNSGSLTVNNCSIFNNTASGHNNYGGGIYNNGIMILTGCNVYDNNELGVTGIGGSIGLGGGIYNSFGNLDLNYCNVFNNTSSTDGGGIYNNFGGYLTIKSSVIHNNTAENDGGGIYTKGFFVYRIVYSEYYEDGYLVYGSTSETDYDSMSNVTLISSNVYNNTAGNNGGGIYNLGSNLTSNDSNVYINTAIRNGGGIYNDWLDYEGGAQNVVSEYYHYDGFLSLSGSEVSKNTAEKDGGGIYNTGNSTLTNSNVKQNNATNRGGAIYNSKTMVLNNSKIQYNIASTGGGVYNDGFKHYSKNYGGILNLSFSDVSKNTAEKDGGGIYNKFISNLTNSNVNQNNATNNGGAIYNENKIVTLSFCRITGNIANLGSAIYCVNGSVNATNNWWGSNGNINSQMIGSGITFSPWLFMTINATPSVINNTEDSLILVSFNNLSDGTTLTSYTPHVGEYIPDGTLVNFQTNLGTIYSPSTENYTFGGVATSNLIADEIAGFAHVNATNTNQTVYVDVLMNPRANIYLNITPDKINPVVGDTATYRFKIGNYGPLPAENVVMRFQVPEGLIFTGARDNVGNQWMYDLNTRTITWNLKTVPVGDPDLWVSFFYSIAGEYVINPLLRTVTYDPDLKNNLQSLTVQALMTPIETVANATQGYVNAATPKDVNAANSEVTNTATKSNTIGTRKSGVSLAGITLAIIMVLGGFITSRKC